jgi:hypothetical protein
MIMSLQDARAREIGKLVITVDWLFLSSERLMRQEYVNIKCLFIDTPLREILPLTGLTLVSPGSSS